MYQFRTVAGRGGYDADSPDAGTTEQIKAVADGDVVRVVGNGKTGSLWFDSLGSSPVKMLEWNDGLVTTSGAWVLAEGQEGMSFIEYDP